MLTWIELGKDCASLRSGVVSVSIASSGQKNASKCGKSWLCGILEKYVKPEIHLAMSGLRYLILKKNKGVVSSNYYKQIYAALKKHSEY
jgi:hypothetical protein